MSSNHTRFTHSVSNLRFCSRVSPAKHQDRSKSLNVASGNHLARRTAVGMSTRQGDLPGGRSINLPPVDVGNSRQTQSKKCFAVDLLQLANGCSSGMERSGVGAWDARDARDARRRGTDEGGIRSAGQSSDGSIARRRSLLPRPSFQASVASAPESCRKLSNATSKSVARRQSDMIRDQESDFAKSWPLAPHGGSKGVARLPLIGGNERKLAGHQPISGKHSDLVGGLNKFNQGRNFRMRRYVSHRQSDEREEHKNPSDVATSPRVVMETLTELKISSGPAPRPVVPSNLSPRRKPERTSSSDSSDLTTVTAESTRVHPDDGAADLGDEDSDEREELDRKCIQWLEDVARERLKNPDKVFLPHLLMS